MTKAPIINLHIWFNWPVGFRFLLAPPPPTTPPPHHRCWLSVLLTPTIIMSSFLVSTLLLNLVPYAMSWPMLKENLVSVCSKFQFDDFCDENYGRRQFEVPGPTTRICISRNLDLHNFAPLTQSGLVTHSSQYVYPPSPPPHICTSAFLPVYLSAFLSFFLSAFLPFCLSAFLPLCLSVFLPICRSLLYAFPPFCLSAFLPFCQLAFLLFGFSTFLPFCLFGPSAFLPFYCFTFCLTSFFLFKFNPFNTSFLCQKYKFLRLIWSRQIFSINMNKGRL